MRGAPASSVANMPGWPSVGIFVTWPKPASRSMFMASSQPSSMPRFSAAIDGWRIQCCRRFTDSSWRFSISFWMMARSGLPAANEFREKAKDAALAAVAWRNLRRFMGGRIIGGAGGCKAGQWWRTRADSSPADAGSE